METLFHNPAFLFWSAFTLMCVVPTIAYYWWRIRQAELDASLKQEMLQRGMSAEEIQMVLTASSAGRCRKTALPKDSKEAEIRFQNGAKEFFVKVSGGKQANS
jgi:hypothetical protein